MLCIGYRASFRFEDVDNQDIEIKLRQEEGEDSTTSQEKRPDWQVKSIPTGIAPTFLTSTITDDESEESNLVNQPSSHSVSKRRKTGFLCNLVLTNL